MSTILGLGIDLVSIERIGSLRLRHGDRFLRRVFTDRELHDHGLEKARDERLAARFAAKEAVMKALGTGWAAGVGFKQIEVSNLPSGQPVVELHGEAAARASMLGALRVHVSMSNEQQWAVAVAVLEAADAPH
ncbi:MAG: holo-ACP synthase [Armatimonadota bacterium]